MPHPDLTLRNKDDVPDLDSLGFKEELPGWRGYVEWEKYPERKRKAAEILKKFKFSGVSRLPLRV